MSMNTEVVLPEIDEPPDLCVKPRSWQWQLLNAVTKVSDLLKIFRVDKKQIGALSRVSAKYPFSITPYYLSLIDVNNPKDPIRLQCVPSSQEENLYPGIQDDPLGEENDEVLPGLIHRYPDRVLITLTNLCPVYCRHCTRKREWGNKKRIRSLGELNKIWDYICQHKEIRDVILSGGDPFMLSTSKLEDILGSIRGISHVEIIRIGTRCPVVLPQRIDDDLVSTLRKYRPIWLNTHFNHPNEITKESAAACDRILSAGIPVNNQSVLLKGVNDNLKTMVELCQGLLKIGVRPYYLFQCDPVSGTGHFRTSVDKGIEIIRHMRGFTSGLCVPAFVVDGLEGGGKIPLQSDYVVSRGKNFLLLRGYKGDTFKYYNPGD